jgi:tetratricopeptide (TPR) repeat protein
MGRYLNTESLALGAAILVITLLGLAFGAHLDWVKASGLALLITILSFFPLATVLQDQLLEYYAESGRIDRALDLAIAIRDSAPNQRFRNRAAVDVALIQLLRRDYANALNNLERVKLSLIKAPEARAVVEGHLAYCLAHQNTQLERAEELARSALKGAPDEPIFGYFLGLVLYKRNQLGEAEEQMAKSLEKNPDPKAPYPGERAYHLAVVRKALGKDAEGPKAQAVSAGGEFAELAKAI